MSALLEHAPSIRRWLLLAGIAGVPLAYLPSLNSNLLRVGLLTIVVLATLALRLTEAVAGARPGFAPLAWPAAAMAGAAVVATLASSDRASALIGDPDRMQGLIPQVLVTVFGMLIADAFAERRSEIAIAVVGSAAVVGLYGLMQAVNADPFRASNPSDFVGPPSTLDNPNFSGAFLAMALPLCWALWIEYPAYRRHVTAAAALVGGCLVATDSQGPWGAAVAGLCVFAALALGYRPLLRRLLIALAGLVALAFVAVVVLEIRTTDPPAVDTTSWERGQLWIAAERMFEERPLAGWGPEGFEVAGVRYRTAEDALYWDIFISDQPHSIYLTALVAGGIVGGIGLLVVAGWALGRAAKVASDDALGAAFASGAIAFLVVGLVSIDQISLRATFWALLAGLALPRPQERKRSSSPDRGSRSRKRRPPPPAPRARAVLLVGMGATLAATVWASTTIVSDVHARAVARDLSAGRFEDGFDGLSSVTSWWTGPEYPLFVTRALGVAVQRDPESAAGHLPRLREAFGFTDEHPDVRSMNAYAEFLYALREHEPSAGEEAVEVWEAALELDRHDPVLRVHLADAYTDRGDPRDALTVLDPLAGFIDDPRLEFLDGRSVDWPSRYLGARATALLELGDRTEAFDLARKALERDPQEPRSLAVLEQEL